MKMTTRFLVGAALAAGALTAIPAQADEGPWVIRVRAVYLDFAQKSDPFTLGSGATAADVPRDSITLNKKWIPDIDVEYFFTPEWSSELVLTVPQSQTVSVKGVGDIGTFKHLPPTLTVKYNFMPGQAFRPYIGIGVNLTLISDVNLTLPALPPTTTSAIPLELSSTSVGLAGQIGFDVRIAEHWLVNADVKYVQLGADVRTGGATVTKVQLDPWLLGIGVGYRF